MSPHATTTSFLEDIIQRINLLGETPVTLTITQLFTLMFVLVGLSFIVFVILNAKASHQATATGLREFKKSNRQNIAASQLLSSIPTDENIQWYGQAYFLGDLQTQQEQKETDAKLRERRRQLKARQEVLRKQCMNASSIGVATASNSNLLSNSGNAVAPVLVVAGTIVVGARNRRNSLAVRVSAKTSPNSRNSSFNGPPSSSVATSNKFPYSSSGSGSHLTLMEGPSEEFYTTPNTVSWNGYHHQLVSPSTPPPTPLGTSTAHPIPIRKVINPTPTDYKQNQTSSNSRYAISGSNSGSMYPLPPIPNNRSSTQLFYASNPELPPQQQKPTNSPPSQFRVESLAAPAGQTSLSSPTLPQLLPAAGIGNSLTSPSSVLETEPGMIMTDLRIGIVPTAPLQNNSAVNTPIAPPQNESAEESEFAKGSNRSRHADDAESSPLPAPPISVSSPPAGHVPSSLHSMHRKPPLTPLKPFGAPPTPTMSPSPHNTYPPTVFISTFDWSSGNQVVSKGSGPLDSQNEQSRTRLSQKTPTESVEDDAVPSTPRPLFYGSSYQLGGAVFRTSSLNSNVSNGSLATCDFLTAIYTNANKGTRTTRGASPSTPTAVSSSRHQHALSLESGSLPTSRGLGGSRWAQYHRPKHGHDRDMSNPNSSTFSSSSHIPKVPPLGNNSLVGSEVDSIYTPINNNSLVSNVVLSSSLDLHPFSNLEYPQTPLLPSQISLRGGNAAQMHSPSAHHPSSYSNRLSRTQSSSAASVHNPYTVGVDYCSYPSTPLLHSDSTSRATDLTGTPLSVSIPTRGGGNPYPHLAIRRSVAVSGRSSRGSHSAPTSARGFSLRSQTPTVFSPVAEVKSESAEATAAGNISLEALRTLTKEEEHGNTTKSVEEEKSKKLITSSSSGGAIDRNTSPLVYDSPPEDSHPPTPVGEGGDLAVEIKDANLQDEDVELEKNVIILSNISMSGVQTIGGAPSASLMASPPSLLPVPSASTLSGPSPPTPANSQMPNNAELALASAELSPSNPNLKLNSSTGTLVTTSTTRDTSTWDFHAVATPVSDYIVSPPSSNTTTAVAAQHISTSPYTSFAPRDQMAAFNTLTVKGRRSNDATPPLAPSSSATCSIPQAPLSPLQTMSGTNTDTSTTPTPTSGIYHDKTNTNESLPSVGSTLSVYHLGGGGTGGGGSSVPATSVQHPTSSPKLQDRSAMPFFVIDDVITEKTNASMLELDHACRVGATTNDKNGADKVDGGYVDNGLPPPQKPWISHHRRGSSMDGHMMPSVASLSCGFASSPNTTLSHNSHPGTSIGSHPHIPPNSRTSANISAAGIAHSRQHSVDLFQISASSSAMLDSVGVAAAQFGYSTAQRE